MLEVKGHKGQRSHGSRSKVTRVRLSLEVEDHSHIGQIRNLKSHLADLQLTGNIGVLGSWVKVSLKVMIGRWAHLNVKLHFFL